MKVRWKPRAPLTYFNDGGRGGGPSDFFGSEILAQRDFFGSMKDVSIFLGSEKKQRDFFGLQKKDMGIFLGMLKNIVILLGRQVLKL